MTLEKFGQINDLDSPKLGHPPPLTQSTGLPTPLLKRVCDDHAMTCELNSDPQFMTIKIENWQKEENCTLAEASRVPSANAQKPAGSCKTLFATGCRRCHRRSPPSPPDDDGDHHRGQAAHLRLVSASVSEKTMW